MSLTRLDPIDGETILPVADAKEHLGVRHTEHDTMIGQMRDGAIAYVERAACMSFAPADFQWTSRCFPARIDLPIGPVTALGAVEHYDADGASSTYVGARLVNGSVIPVVGGVFPDANGYASITFTAGLANPTDAPDLLDAVKLIIGHRYRNREAVNIGNIVTELPLGVDALIQTHREVMV